MTSSWSAAQEFLTGLSNEEKNHLYNNLLMVEKIHQKNQDVKHYSLRKLRRASRRLFDDRKRTFRCVNENQDEIVIHQIQEQHLLKTCYKIEILYNLTKMDFFFVEELLTILKNEYSQEHEFQFAAV